MKNGDERLVVLNRVAKSIVEGLRGAHSIYVFAHPRRKGTTPLPVTKMYNTAWKRARAQKRTHHYALLAGGTGESDRGGRQGLHRRVPQKSRDHLASAPNRLTEELPTD